MNESTALFNPSGKTHLAKQLLAILFCCFFIAIFQIAAQAQSRVELGRGIDPADPNIILLKDVWAKTLSNAKAPAGIKFPPFLYVISEDEQKGMNKDPNVPDAFATLVSIQSQYYPVVVVNMSLLTKIIEGNDARLAYVLGHEISHHTLGHVKAVRATGKTKFLLTAFSREQELNADKNGMMLTLASGYAFQDALGGMRRFIELGMEYSPLEAISVSHPSWSQRLEKMDKERATLWSSMSAFRSGVVFLAVEQFGSAERCFDLVVKQFPDCYEAWANLGYARLMQYCDLLSPDDIRDFDVGHILTTGFYTRPRSLEDRGRGKDANLWRQAVEALNQALTLNPHLTLAKANLGIAYLVKPDGKDAKSATQFLEEAVGDLKDDKDLDLLRRIVILANAGVANLAAGNLELSGKRTLEAFDLGGNKSLLTAPAILYNYAVALEREGTPEQKKKAAQILYDYLRVASRSSVWFPIGNERYQHLCSEQSLACKPAESIVMVANRLIFGLELGKGRTVGLTDSMANVEKSLGKPVPIPVVKNASIRKLKYPQMGIEILGREQVMAISLLTPAAPPISVRRRGLGSQANLLRVGMPEAQFTSIVGKEFTDTKIINPLIPYRFYPDLGIAARFIKGVVSEIMIVQVPREK
ncbi:MAG: M48 family metalloprotease [Acidobacteriota bacterium]